MEVVPRAADAPDMVVHTRAFAAMWELPVMYSVLPFRFRAWVRECRERDREARGRAAVLGRIKRQGYQKRGTIYYETELKKRHECLGGTGLSREYEGSSRI